MASLNRYCCFILVVVQGLLVTRSAGFLATGDDALIQNSTAVHACVGDNVTLSFSLVTGIQLHNIQWLFTSETSSRIIPIAYYRDGTFTAESALAQRLHYLGHGVMMLSDLTVQDYGRYVMLVPLQDGKIFESRLNVNVAEDAASISGVLTITQSEQAVYDNTTGQLHVQLVCTLSTVQAPNASDVVWTTPTGQRASSSSHHNNSFYFILPNPVKEGTYGCGLPALSFTSRCSSTHGPQEVTVHVDPVAARLTLLEAKEAANRDENRKLKEELSRTRGELKDTKEAFAKTNITLTDRLQGMETDFASLQDRRSKHTSFHAILNDSLNDIHIGDHVTFNDVRYNHGDAYNSKTGEFTAPITGSYFFIFTLTPIAGGQYSNSVLRVGRNDNSSHAHAYLYTKYDTEYFHMATSHALVNLQRGERVWVEAFGLDLYYYHILSSFTGFLVHAPY